MKHVTAMFLGLCLVVGQFGCRGYSTDEPPIHLNRNMFIQEKGKAYRYSDFFEDGQYMRKRIPGTVARGEFHEDEHYYLGKVDGKPADSFPSNLEMDDAFIKRGQWMFERTCAACHASIGNGDGLVGRRLLVKPTSFHSDYMYEKPPGYFFEVITNGERTMQPYGHLVGVKDRWAIVAYIRALQISQDVNSDTIKRSASSWRQN